MDQYITGVISIFEFLLKTRQEFIITDDGSYFWKDRTKTKEDFVEQLFQNIEILEQQFYLAISTSILKTKVMGPYLLILLEESQNAEETMVDRSNSENYIKENSEQMMNWFASEFSVKFNQLKIETSNKVLNAGPFNIEVLSQIKSKNDVQTFTENLMKVKVIRKKYYDNLDVQS